MTLILLGLERSPTFRDMERTNVMPHYNSVFRDLLKLMPWAAFEKLVEEHGSDYRVRQLSTKSQLIALLYGQLAGAMGLREIVTGLESQARRLYHLGATPPRRSTLSDANRLRSSDVFADLLDHLLTLAHRGLRRHVGEATFLIDSTSVRLTGLSGPWARFSEGIYGAKVHVIYDPDADRPTYAVVTAAKVNDISVAKTMPIVAGATYVWDLGYYDYGWWAELAEAGCRIVTRFKANTPLAPVAELPVPEGAAILSDRIGYLPARQARSRRNPFQDPVREVRVRIDSGKVLRILTNDLDADAQEIADLYKRRWAIELFFRWVKQSLRITRFFGTSENAVRIQIAVALIAFLLLRMAQARLAVPLSPLAFARLVRLNLMHRRRIDRLLNDGPQIDPNANQMTLQWT
jgi:IS4 transposase